MKEPAVTHLTESRVGPRPDLAMLEERMSSGSCLEASDVNSIINPVADTVHQLCYPVPEEKKLRKLIKRIKERNGNVMVNNERNTGLGRRPQHVAFSRLLHRILQPP